MLRGKSVPAWPVGLGLDFGFALLEPDALAIHLEDIALPVARHDDGRANVVAEDHPRIDVSTQGRLQVGQHHRKGQRGDPEESMAAYWLTAAAWSLWVRPKASSLSGVNLRLTFLTAIFGLFSIHLRTR